MNKCPARAVLVGELIIIADADDEKRPLKDNGAYIESYHCSNPHTHPHCIPDGRETCGNILYNMRLRDFKSLHI